VSRRRGGIAVALLALLAVGLVLLALRPKAPPQAPPVIPTAGAVAMQGHEVWVWTGPAQCPGTLGSGSSAASSDTSSSPSAAGGGSSIAHYDGTTWTSTAVPLAVVSTLTFSGTHLGVAVGRLPDCHHEILVTTDGGATWAPVSGVPALADASLSGHTLWGVTTTSGQHAVRRYQLADDGTVSLAGPGRPTNPCTTGAGPPSQVAAPASATALLLCQNLGIDERQVDRTRTAGVSWEIVVDQRPQTGFDGAGVDVTQLSAVGQRNVWALFVDPQGECHEGQVRHSRNGGLSWTRLTCPSQTAAVDQVYGLDFASRTVGALVGLDGDRGTVLVTVDSGQTWHAIATPPTS